MYRALIYFNLGLAIAQNNYRPITIYGCHSGNTQRYSYDTTAKVIYRVDDTRCFDYTGTLDGNDTRVAINKCDLREDNQKWNFEIVSQIYH